MTDTLIHEALNSHDTKKVEWLNEFTCSGVNNVDRKRNLTNFNAPLYEKYLEAKNNEV